MRVAALLALLVAGIVVSILAGDSTALTAVGFVLIGLASILLVALAFYEVGRSEDRDRARGRS
jgi:uncharacterized membrane protein YuzA (DUF378 family)